MTTSNFPDQAEAFRVVAEAIDEAIWILGPDHCLEYANPSALKLTGHGLGHLQAKPLVAIVVPADRARLTERLSGQVAPTAPIVLHLLRQDRSEVAVALSIQVLSDRCSLITGRNLGALGQIQERLHSRESLYATIINQSPDGIVLVDAETLHFTEFNEAACTALGYTREEFCRLGLEDIRLPMPDEPF